MTNQVSIARSYKEVKLNTNYPVTDLCIPPGASFCDRIPKLPNANLARAVKFTEFAVQERLDREMLRFTVVYNGPRSTVPEYRANIVSNLITGKAAA